MPPSDGPIQHWGGDLRGRSRYGGPVFSRFGKGVYCLAPGIPSPIFLQNIENKRFILPLYAKSLTLQELEAKS